MRSTIVLCLAAAASLSAQVHFTKASPEQVDITIDGKPFAAFHNGANVNKPYLAPLRSASGKIITRHFPMEEVAGESRDHLHHTGLWFSFDDVNGVKLWENHPSYTKGKIGKEVVRKVEFKDGNPGKLAAVIDWVDPNGIPLLTENREMSFYPDPKLRIIDFQITLTADQDITFGDTKEGAFAIRLAEPFTERKGMKMTDANGRHGMKEVWGKRSNWVDYVTDLDGERLGVAMMDHPSNPRHPTYWHARDYGLFALNPFGQNAFDDKQPESQWKLPKGQKLEFRWRVVIHPGDSDLAALFKEYEAKR